MSTRPPPRSVDVAIVGAGTAGLAAYHAAIANGGRVVLIEHGPHGTMCARVGCMPSKLLIAAAEVAQSARSAARFGIGGSFEVDGRAVMERVRRERDRFVDFVVARVGRIPAEQKIVGRARFVAPQVLEVDVGRLERSERTHDQLGGQLIEARAVIIATGSSPTVPPAFEAVRERLVVSDDVFDWTTLPESVAVFGTGSIGLELGQALHRLGVRVHVFGRQGTIGPLTDPVVRASAEAALRSEMALDSEAKVHAVRRDGNGVAVEFESDGQARAENFAFALVATGRLPNLAGLGLENAGVALDRRGVPLFDRATRQCGSAPVFIAGDASQDIPLLHEAAEQGRIAGENAARYPNVQSRARLSPLQIVFCDPQIAMVGATFEELSEGGGEPVIGEVSFEDQGRSRIMGQNQGVGRVYADPASGRFLGAEIVGPCAEHLGHLLAWAHQQALTIDQMLAMPFYHPVVEEGVRTALRDASTKRKAGYDHPK
jgi:dihydrolipoyl dehydrogenase